MTFLQFTTSSFRRQTLYPYFLRRQLRFFNPASPHRQTQPHFSIKHCPHFYPTQHHLLTPFPPLTRKNRTHVRSFRSLSYSVSPLELIPKSINFLELSLVYLIFTPFVRLIFVLYLIHILLFRLFSGLRFYLSH